MSRTRTKRRASNRVVGFAAVAAIGAAVAGGAVAVAGDSGNEESGPSRLQAQVASVDQRLTDSFALFRSDDLQVDEPGRETGPNPFAQNTSLSRAVQVERGGSVYVIPGDDTVCLGDQINYGHTCVSVDDAIDGKLFLVTLADPRTPGTTVSGLAPDGVAHATISLTTGKALTVPVRDNVYDVKLDESNGKVAGVSWESKTGQTSSLDFPNGIDRPNPPSGAIAPSK